MKARPTVLVFSDLDGTLLDHTSYSWQAAAPALSVLRAEKCGLILASSKTAAEIEKLRSDIGFADWPSIVENGGGVFEPGESGADDSPIYRILRTRLSNLPIGFVGFGDMAISEVCDRTGLSEQEARQAKMRRFSEPGVWTGSDDAFHDFTSAATAAGLLVQRGGRFHSVSFGGTKADRMDDLIARFSPDLTIALGDAPNDTQMLERADYGVIVANHHTSQLPRLQGEETGRIRRTLREGPEGWSDAVFEILDEISMVRDKSSHG